ncbi:MAG TPA: VOC family protein [Sphingomonas sp.]|jgi:predicted lactoylglutathione lyase|nr:VOC family protein [Sphingomonas sp.]
MARMIFVNLPVADVAASTAFYTALGFELDPRFSNENASAMVWSDAISVMLLAHDFYRTFTTKAIADTRTTSAVLLCLSCDDRAGVDAITEAAIAAGGHETREPQDLGFMYGRAFEDLDGHVYEPMYMDLDAALSAFAEPQTAEA